MRKFAVALALATTALAGPAYARDGAWYVGLEGGGMIVENIQYDIFPTNGGVIRNAAEVNHSAGFDVDGIVGYDFGPTRVEFELGYKRANVDAITTAGLNTTNQLPGGVNGRFQQADGDTTALSFMLNSMFDFGGVDSPWSGAIGAGIGVARVKASNYSLTGAAADFADDSDTSVAYQVIAGVRRAITDNVDLGVKYRFFNVEQVDLVLNDGRESTGRFRSHSFLLSAIYNFGAPEAPVVAAPPPPAPGPFIVFFDWDRSDITTEAASILDNVAAQYASTGQASVTLAGHADKSGSDQYNVGLSERRAAAVRDYLVGKGVPGGVITSEAFGESRPLVETADGVREPQNRRVEINFAGGAAPSM
jgi:OmpA-OmpF porin, OOP family